MAQKSLSVSKSNQTTLGNTKDVTWTPSDWSSLSNSIPDNSTITAASLVVEFSCSATNGNYRILAGSTELVNEQSSTGGHSHTLNVLNYVTKTGVDAGNITSNFILRVKSSALTRIWSNIKATLTLTYTLPTHKVTLDANGGAVSPTYVNITDGNTYGTLPTPTRTGYTFNYWTLNGTRIYSTTKVTSSHTLVANWTVNTHTITWKNADGTVLETDTGVAYGTTPTYNGSTPTKASTAEYTYAFSGWSPSVGAITGNTTYTAQFTATKRKYTISVSAENGSVSGGGTYEYGSSVTLTAKPNDGYVFKQWSDGNTDNPRTVTVTGNVTYTAEFEAVLPEFTVVQMLYNNKQISKDNKVPAGQSFRLVAGVK